MKNERNESLHTTHTQLDDDDDNMKVMQKRRKKKFLDVLTFHNLQPDMLVFTIKSACAPIGEWLSKNYYLFNRPPLNSQ